MEPLRSSTTTMSRARCASADSAVTGAAIVRSRYTTPLLPCTSLDWDSVPVSCTPCGSWLPTARGGSVNGPFPPPLRASCGASTALAVPTTSVAKMHRVARGERMSRQRRVTSGAIGNPPSPVRRYATLISLGAAWLRAPLREVWRECSHRLVGHCRQGYVKRTEHFLPNFY